MHDAATSNHNVAVTELSGSENSQRIDWFTQFLDLNPAGHVWDAMGRHEAARLDPPKLYYIYSCESRFTIRISPRCE